MIYNINILDRIYSGTGDTRPLAIRDALSQMLQAETSGLEHAKRWCLQYLRNEYISRKLAVFDSSPYTILELVAMFAEARDYAITSNTTPARYPLANAIATAKSVTLVSVLQGWGTAILAKLQTLGAISYKYEEGIDLISGSSDVPTLLDNMSQIVDYIEDTRT